MLAIQKLTIGKAMTTANLRWFSKLPFHITLTMPNLSPTMEKGNLAKWSKAVGDKIDVGDVLAEIETDKATVDFEMQEEGYVARLLIEEGAQDVLLGEPVAILVDSKDDINSFKFWTPEDIDDVSEALCPKQEDCAPIPAATPATPAPSKVSGDRVFASPLARKTASERSLNINSISGSGPNGRIIQADVEAALASGPP